MAHSADAELPKVRPDLVYAVLCLVAPQVYRGTLNLVGVVNTLWESALPTTKDLYRVVGWHGGLGEFELKERIMNADGGLVDLPPPDTVPFTLGQPKLYYGLVTIEIGTYGDYFFLGFLDDQPAFRIPFQVVPFTTGPSP